MAMAMRRFRMWALLFAALFAAGCSTPRRPYARDPLLRHGRGVWGDPARQAVAESPPILEPDAPRAPAQDSPLMLVTDVPK
jgi:hypothetical protein